MSEQAAIRLVEVEKAFGQVVALAGLELEVAPGEFHTLLGPSGCGKTTALRVIAGFEGPDRGVVSIAGRQVAGHGVLVPPEERRVGMVFQDFALFPHLTVGGNIGYGVASRADRSLRVGELLDLIGMAGDERRMPHELSGGQQQRVALARALAPAPEVVLLDEPFSNLDAALRERVRTEIKEILAAAGTTVLFVTHDQEEALSLSDRVSVMRAGKVLQAAAPAELYRRPRDQWIARFLGEADFLPGHAAAGRAVTTYGSFATDLVGPVEIMVRPESVMVHPGTDGTVIRRQYFGHDQLLTIALTGGGEIRSRLGPSPELALGERVGVKIDDAVVYPAASA